MGDPPSPTASPTRTFGVAGEPEELSTKGEAVDSRSPESLTRFPTGLCSPSTGLPARRIRSTINFLRLCRISQSATAPEKMRMKVKVAASMLVSRRAARQRSELLANATIASSVRRKTRVLRRQTSNVQSAFARLRRDMRRTSNIEFKSTGQRSAVRRERAMPLCGKPTSREQSARTSGAVTLRREVVRSPRRPNRPREAGDSVLVKTERERPSNSRREFRFLRGNPFVRAVGSDVVAKTADADLRDD